MPKKQIPIRILVIETVLVTTLVLFTLQFIKNLLFDPIDTLSFTERLRWRFFKFFRTTSYFKKNYKPDIDKAQADIYSQSAFQLKNKTQDKPVKQGQLVSQYLTHLNRDGVPCQQILKELKELNQIYDCSVEHAKNAKFTGSIYSTEEKQIEMNAEIFKIYCWSNPLHVDMFKSIRKMEAEMVRQVINMYEGDKQVVGTVSSGGTESIFLAVTAYRNLYTSKYGEGINVPIPQLIVPQTAHPAFNKACHYLKVKVITVKPNPVTHKMEAAHYAKYLSNKRTMAIVCSSPQYPFGVFDQVQEICAAGAKYGVPVHMDSCLGSFLTPFVHQAGFTDLPLVNWETCPGLTSISCDTHKYGYTPKGTSIIMFKNKDLRYHSTYSLTTWPGGIYSTPTMAGSRAGVNVAMAWATMRSIGYNGYVERTREIIQLTRKLDQIARSIPGLKTIKPELQTVTFFSDKYNIFKFLSAMADRGWELQALQYPSAIHLGVTYSHVMRGQAFIDEFTKDMTEVGNLLNKVGDGTDLGKDACAFYGSTQEIPDRSIVEDLSVEYWNAYYGIQE